MQLGKIRHEDPAGVAFLERHIIHRAEVEQKYYKELEQKSKRPRRKH